MFLIVIAYVYSITDTIASTVNGVITITQPNPISSGAFTSYGAMRDFIFSALTLFLIPFLLLLSFASSFINRNQSVVGYLINSMAVLMATPIVIYAFAEITTNLLNVSILNPAYIYTLYFNNFVFICIINMFLALASFAFVRQGVVSQ
jgi:hypothetical protein